MTRPSVWINVGHDSAYLRDVVPSADIGVVGSALYPPPQNRIGRPDLRAVSYALDPATFQMQVSASAQSGPFRRLPWADHDIDPATFVRRPSRARHLVQVTGAAAFGAGADIAIAPYFYAVDSSDPALQASIELGQAALEEHGSDRAIPGIFVHSNALLPQHIDRLLNVITGTGFDAVYLLIAVDSPSTAPIADEAALVGLRLLIQVAEANGIWVLWGATDSSGLLPVCWSRTASIAIGAETHLRRRRQRPATGRGGYRSPNPRVFAPLLLSEIRTAHHDQWVTARPAAVECRCAACRRLGATVGRAAHYLNSHVSLAAELRATPDPAASLTDRVETAIATLNEAGSGPTDADARRHLGHWQAILGIA